MSAALTISMHDSAPNRTILYLNGVTVSFDGFKALNNLSLVIEEGELRAIIGPNGAGKSTMMDVITGLTKPDSGEVIFQQNIDLTRHDEAHIANLGIGRKFQKPSCIGSLTVHDNLDLALRGQRRLFSALLRKRSAQQLQRIDELLELVGLIQQRHQPASALSHGQKQWLEIGMLLAQDPQLLLVDEPVAGMTPQEVERTAELLTGLAGRHSVVVVEHDMAFVRAIAQQRVTVLHQGSVLAEGPMAQVQSDPRVIEVYLGA
ncbi:MAG: urea ABC transporter ATP-binding protein UrtD [Pseudomonadales bacterium]|jgi:urea transport system ATP-binding protein|nr:urea ABC transporter ATP-binding protein UrtD [Pseudomonadales bacterium]HMU90228.1 urea ABC transporter ATP-binding protein UrtD [Pseudomonadales bacterium]HMW15355.1 urea ABC transporter ATP-binding protein UrtD [Pseudomonadales bacterium]HMW82255.1 urea ABC transporter ATP-binding protein UrtD [Pseudomonadales bacterium]HMY97299.1 urea ABC transporter ATP-binding protein UrtD [Pseudomonadales bacterium]